ncbi:MAG: hypothetical protein MJ124_08375 [Lachnospiraceae bacterium]|nr:hypothetical protein [Lachnospiraceae bacterium]
MGISYETLIVAPKSQEASTYKIQQDSRAQNQQPLLQQAAEQQNLHDSQRTTKTEDKGRGNNRHDAKEKGSNEYERLRAEEEKKKKEEQMNEEHRRLTGSTFDITI